MENFSRQNIVLLADSAVREYLFIVDYNDCRFNGFARKMYILDSISDENLKSEPLNYNLAEPFLVRDLRDGKLAEKVLRACWSGEKLSLDRGIKIQTNKF